MQAKADGAESKTFDPGFAAAGEVFSLEYAQLLTERMDLGAEVVAGTEETVEAGEGPKAKWNRGPGFKPQESELAPAQTA